MKRYKLLKDLPTFKAGDLFELREDGCLWLLCPMGQKNHRKPLVMAYCRSTLDKFPNILKDWFEEIHEQPKTVWDLKNGDEYWRLDSFGIACFLWAGFEYEKDMRDAGDVFLIEEDAQRELARRKAKVILEQDTKGFKPDWDQTSPAEGKWVYTVCHDNLSDKLIVNGYARVQFSCSIWFATEEDAEESIRKHEKEWKIYLEVEK